MLLNDLSLQTDDYRRTGIPTPLYNPYAWTRLGHVLSFDQPPPVGFSYCNSRAENEARPHSCGGLAWTDELAAENSYRALLAFYDAFPALRAATAAAAPPDGWATTAPTDLYLTGESYAGIYIPTLARKIVTNNNSSHIALRGFAVGDGCLGIQTDICGVLNPDNSVDNTTAQYDVWNVVFLAGHGQISMNTFVSVMNACVSADSSEHDFAQLVSRGMSSSNRNSFNLSDQSCRDALREMDEKIGGVYAYGCVYLLKSGVSNWYPAALRIANPDTPRASSVFLVFFLALVCTTSAPTATAC